MNAEDTEAMQALDNRLRKIFAGLDATPGFEQRLQARIATLAAQPSAEALGRLEQEHDRARAPADRAARVDGLAITIGGIGSLVAVWRLAPSIAHLYSTSLEAGRSARRRLWAAAAARLRSAGDRWLQASSPQFLAATSER